MAQEEQLSHFSLIIYPNAFRLDSGIELEPISRFEGDYSMLNQYQQIKIPGFDGAQVIQLEAFWNHVLAKQVTEVVFPVVGVETIVKWSNTRQIQEKFKLHAKLQFAKIS